NTPLGYITEGRQVYEGVNSYVPFGTCGEKFFGMPPAIINAFTDVANTVMEDHLVYMKASLSCSDKLYGNSWITPPISLGPSDGLIDIYGCNDSCATSFPAPNSSPNLDLDFWYVRRAFEDVFANLDDKLIFNESQFLTNGLRVTVPSATGNDVPIGINIPGCSGSRILLWGCSPYKTIQTDISNGGFFDTACLNFAYGGTGDINGCVRTGFDPGSAVLARDLRDSWAGALDSFYNPHRDSGDLGQASTELMWGCVDLQPPCCKEYADSIIPEKEIYRNWRTCVLCYCKDFDDSPNGNSLIAYEATYNPATYNWRTNASTLPHVLWWSGENIPGLGDIGPLPTDEPIAIRYDDYDSLTYMIENSIPTIAVEPFCAYHTGPNKYSQVGAQVFQPFRSEKLVDGAPNLQPELCTGVSTSHKFYGNCGTPVPFDTYAGGITPQINVVRKSVWPEIMTVHKIECESNGYKLHVSREYFEHQRNWYHIGPNCEGIATAFKRYGLIEAGQTAYSYPCGEVHYPACADPSGNTGGSAALPFVLPVMTPTDAVGPIYPAESSPCATGTEIFYETDTDAITGKTTSDEHPGVGSYSSCMYYPAISGEQFWSFYNLLYDLGKGVGGVADSKFLSDAGIHVISDVICGDCPDPGHPFNLRGVQVTGTLEPVFSSVSEMRSSPHSCIQDLNECGGMFWNNKEFFPRKSYAVNTRIAPFGALSICEQNAELEAPSWYDGHTGKSNSGPGTWDQSPNKAELAGGRFVDACDSGAIVLARTAIDIDDNFIHIPFLNEDGSAPSVLALQGQIHPGFTSNLNQKTCVYADSGECLDYWPEHNDSTIRDITFSPDEYGYYLYDLVASGSHDCLFTPFKIMVDVECCPDRVGHKGSNLTGPSGSEPTFLNYMARIPASTCDGWVTNPNCRCQYGNQEPWDTCQRWQNGQALPGLQSLKVIVGAVIESGGDVCHTGGCTIYESEYNNMTPVEYWSQPTPIIKYFMDPAQNDPERFQTLLDPSGVINSDLIPCNEECVLFLYGPDSTIPTGEITYNHHVVEIRPIYDFNGHTYTLIEEKCIDVFVFEGAMYRFHQNTVFAANPGNCCDEACSCDWNVCEDYVNGIQIMSPGVDPSGYVVLEADIPSEPEGTGVKYTDFVDNLGCISYYEPRSCSYNSNVLFTITEAP
ncbi:hypothetical protein OAQ45_01050, partial [Candidatus Marinimicrobia bacterium]|nr:hypothetical protein [Candidatus Neomarinimicrobiota bacterium]